MRALYLTPRQAIFFAMHDVMGEAARPSVAEQSDQFELLAYRQQILSWVHQVQEAAAVISRSEDFRLSHHRSEPGFDLEEHRAGLQDGFVRGASRGLAQKTHPVQANTSQPAPAVGPFDERLASRSSGVPSSL